MRHVLPLAAALAFAAAPALAAGNPQGPYVGKEIKLNCSDNTAATLSFKGNNQKNGTLRIIKVDEKGVTAANYDVALKVDPLNRIYNNPSQGVELMENSKQVTISYKAGKRDFVVACPRPAGQPTLKQ